MDDRINAYLDGELAFDALDAREQERARALEAAIRTAAAAYAVVHAPDLTERVMERLPASPAGAEGADTPAPSRPRRDRGRRSLVDWLGSFIPSPGLAPRPALALAGFALVIGFVLGALAPLGPGSASESAVVEDAVPRVFVRFELEAEGARDVRLAGSFTGWEPRHELSPLGEGRWTVTVALEPGVHDYVFLVDGDEFIADPYAPQVSDGFGGYNSRLALLAPAS
jgi:hypothetical protein